MGSKVIREKLTVAQLMSKFHVYVEPVLTASILSQGIRQYRATSYVTGLSRERRGHPDTDLGVLTVQLHAISLFTARLHVDAFPSIRLCTQGSTCHGWIPPSYDVDTGALLRSS
jgi:hypothetical protein